MTDTVLSDREANRYLSQLIHKKCARTDVSVTLIRPGVDGITVDLRCDSDDQPNAKWVRVSEPPEWQRGESILKMRYLDEIAKQLNCADLPDCSA